MYLKSLKTICEEVNLLCSWEMSTCKLTKKTLSNILLHVFCLHFLRMHDDYFFQRSFESVWTQFLSRNISGKEVKLLARCSLLVRYCSLLVSFCSLLVTFCSLLVTFCSLLVNFCLMLVTFCSLLVTFCSLLVTFCLLLVTFCSLTVTFCSLLVTFCSFPVTFCSLLEKKFWRTFFLSESKQFNLRIT